MSLNIPRVVCSLFHYCNSCFISEYLYHVIIPLQILSVLFLSDTSHSQDTAPWPQSQPSDHQCLRDWCQCPRPSTTVTWLRPNNKAAATMTHQFSDIRECGRERVEIIIKSIIFSINIVMTSNKIICVNKERHHAYVSPSPRSPAPLSPAVFVCWD